MQVKGESSLNKLIILFVFDKMESALSEMKRAPEYSYTVINDDIETAVNEIIAIIDK